jgi:hypothetical protein
VSIDAATEATYRVVRRGGDFSRLLANLAFIDGLRQEEGEQFTLSLSFAVSAANFREMAEFVNLGQRFHARVIFTLFRNWGHLTASQFDAMNIAGQNHPLHPEFLRMLNAPELGDPMVDLCNLTGLRQT